MIGIKRIGLAVCLLGLLVTACYPAEKNTSSTQNIPSQPTPSVSDTAVSRQPANSTHTATLIPTASSTAELSLTPTSSATVTPQPSPTSIPPIVFAAIGDYGTGDQAEADVANLVLSWQPDFIITLGDNNYPIGAADHIDDAIGQYYHSYIYPYKGNFGEGADQNRFFPSLGNHDMISDNGRPYFDYFTLPGNQRYYDFTWGPVHLFALDNIETEPDGVGASSSQADWLKTGLTASTSAWNIVYMHYPPYSSGWHGSTDWARWPYKDWGADAVLAGHDHTYERLDVGGLTYFVNGLGGGGIYDFLNILEGSLVRYNGDYGAMRIEATDSYMVFEFINRRAEVVDSYVLNK